MNFPSGWARKCPVVISAAKITASLTNYRALLTRTALPEEMITQGGPFAALESGGDIRFSADAAGTVRLPCDVQTFRLHSTPAQSQIKILVQIPVVNASTDTTIYVWYGKPGEVQPGPADPFGSQAAYPSATELHTGVGQHTRVIPDQTGKGRHLTATAPALLWRYREKLTGGPSDHQGLLYDGSCYFGIGTQHLRRRATIAGSDLATNTNPCGAVDALADHLGAGQVHNGLLYVPVEKWVPGGPSLVQHIAMFSATTLAFVADFDISAQGHECSALCIDPAAGVVYVASYDDGSRFWKYDLSSGSYLGTLVLSHTLPKIQGVALFDGYFYVSCLLGGTARIMQVAPDGSIAGGVVATNKWEESTATTRPGSVYESVCVHASRLYWWDGSTFELFVYDWIGAADSPVGGGYALISQQNTHGKASVPYTLPNGGTITLLVRPKTFYDFNTIFDNSVNADQWECFTYADGKIGVRISSTILSYNLNLLSGANSFYVVHFTWAKLGSVATVQLYVNGALRASNTNITWAEPGATFYLAGGNAGNTLGNNHYALVEIASEVRSEAWLQADYEHLLAPATFFAVGTPEGASLARRQSAYRWRLDDGTEAGATWAGAENAPLTAGAGTRRLRVQLAATGDPPSEQYRLEYRKVGDPDWTPVS